MTEDFTPSNQKIINKLVQLKKGKKIKKYWSYDGKIYAKAHESQSKCKINCIDDIDIMITSAIEEGYLKEPESESDAEGDTVTVAEPGGAGNTAGAMQVTETTVNTVSMDY